LKLALVHVLDELGGGHQRGGDVFLFGPHQEESCARLDLGLDRIPGFVFDRSSL
jgi:hypothetical protein